MAFGPGFMEQRPDLCSWVGRCIGQWSDVEIQLARLLSTVLGTTAVVAFSVLSELSGRRQQLRVLEAVTKSSNISAAERELILATLRKTGGVAKRRDALAHHCWGISDQLPDALLLVSSETYLRTIAATVDRGPSLDVVRLREAEIKSNEVLVYRVHDFEELARDLTGAHKLLYDVNGVALRPTGVERDQLCAELARRI